MPLIRFLKARVPFVMTVSIVLSVFSFVMAVFALSAVTKLAHPDTVVTKIVTQSATPSASKTAASATATPSAAPTPNRFTKGIPLGRPATPGPTPVASPIQ